MHSSGVVWPNSCIVQTNAHKMGEVFQEVCETIQPYRGLACAFLGTCCCLCPSSTLHRMPIIDNLPRMPCHYGAGLCVLKAAAGVHFCRITSAVKMILFHACIESRIVEAPLRKFALLRPALHACYSLTHIQVISCGTPYSLLSQGNFCCGALGQCDAYPDDPIGQACMHACYTEHCRILAFCASWAHLGL